MNKWNIDSKNPTKYKNEDTIVFWNVAKSFQDDHLNLISTNVCIYFTLRCAF